MSFPNHFKYEETTRTIVVEFGDGSIIRYHGTGLNPEFALTGLNPELAFLQTTNPHRKSDFINFLKANPRIKKEVLQEPDPAYRQGEPEQNAAQISQQQNGITQGNSVPSWLSGWCYKPQMQTEQPSRLTDQQGNPNENG
jgi:hypothetical protein